jgi:hypothetical protein
LIVLIIKNSMNTKENVLLEKIKEKELDLNE